MKVRSCKILDPVYGVHYYVQRGGTLQSAVDKYAKYSGIPTWQLEQSPAHRGHFGAHADVRCGFIWLHDKAGSGSISHEVSHAVNYFFCKMGATDLGQIDELFAYYTQWLVSQIVRRLF